MYRRVIFFFWCHNHIQALDTTMTILLNRPLSLLHGKVDLEPAPSSFLYFAVMAFFTTYPSLPQTRKVVITASNYTKVANLSRPDYNAVKIINLLFTIPIRTLTFVDSGCLQFVHIQSCPESCIERSNHCLFGKLNMI